MQEYDCFIKLFHLHINLKSWLLGEAIFLGDTMVGRGIFFNKSLLLGDYLE